MLAFCLEEPHREGVLYRFRPLHWVKASKPRTDLQKRPHFMKLLLSICLFPFLVVTAATADSLATYAFDFSSTSNFNLGVNFTAFVPVPMGANFLILATGTSDLYEQAGGVGL